jgi:PleD family two-component response regulator
MQTARTVGNDDRGVRQHTRAFLQRWREQLGTQTTPWPAAQASALYEDLEGLCALAERERVAEIAEPALELTVYLCSFVDGDNAPNPAQRQGLERLIEQLTTAVGRGTTPAHGAHRALAANATAPRQVFYLRNAAHELAGLAPRLGQEGCVVRPFETRERAILALDEISPDVLIIDEAFVADVHAMTEAAQRKRTTQRDAPLCVVLAESTDRARTLFAQRAGADAVITERDPIALVVQLDELRAQQRARDFRVLIVEDDRSQAKFCDSILRHCGMLTCICEDAGRVAAALNEFKPDLVLLDLYLPEGNGIEIAQRIREQPRHAFLPIVFLTGEHDQDLRFDAIRVGADDFITKPIKPRHLVTAVESRIKRARELHAGRPEHRGERRGILSARDVLTREVLRVAHDEQDRCPALAFIAVDDVDKITHAVGFVASGTLPQQIAAALAAELPGERTLSAWGEMRFVVLLQAADELTLRETLEDLRRKVDGRLWLSDETPLRLQFSLGCVRVPADINKVDELLERARALCVKAQQAGGARCEFDLRSRGGERDEDPRRRLLRAILRAPSLRGTGRLDFQPLLPLSGQIAGQYEARMGTTSRRPPGDVMPRSSMKRARWERRCLRAACNGWMH